MIRQQKQKRVWLVSTAGRFPLGLGSVEASSKREAVRLGEAEFKRRVNVEKADKEVMAL